MPTKTAKPTGVTKEKKVPLRRKITRRTLQDPKISRKNLYAVIKTMIDSKLLPPIQGINKLNKEQLIESIPTYAIANIYMSLKQNGETFEKKLESMNKEQKGLYGTLSEYTSEQLKETLNALKIAIVNKNMMRRDELIYQIITSGNAPQVISHLGGSVQQVVSNQVPPEVIKPVQKQAPKNVQQITMQIDNGMKPGNRKQLPPQAIKAALRIAGKTTLISKP